MRLINKTTTYLLATAGLALACVVFMMAAAPDQIPPPVSPAASDRPSSLTPPPRLLTTHTDAPQRSLPTHAVRGVNYAHIHRGGMGYGSDASQRELTHLQGLGVDWVALTPFGYQHTADQDHVAGFDPDEPLSTFSPDAGDRLSNPSTEPPNTGRPRVGRDPSLTERHLAKQVAAAHRLGVKALIKPHIWSREFWQGDAWHGTIDQKTPEDHERWRRSYLRFILYYAALARDTNADALCIGTELVSQTTQYPGDWVTLIREVRKIYPGKLTYAAHWDKEFQAVTFWDQMDAIGISAYFPLNAPDDATVDQLVQAWRPHKQLIQAVHTRHGKPVVFLEIGYRPVTGAYRGPWLDTGGETDPMIQARAYEALFQTYADEPWWHGLFIWKVFTHADRDDHHGKGPGFSFRNRPAEQVIRQWFQKP